MSSWPTRTRLDAFRVANRAVERALSRRIKEEDLKWFPFQLAFLLVNLLGMADPDSAERATVDLLFFPTGGGKTEAYLGLAAFAMVLRRLRNPGHGGRAGAGVSVIMRYTLRLLTLDQLSRASGSCAPSNSSAPRTPTGTVSGHSRSVCGSAKPPPPTKWVREATREETRRAVRPSSSNPILAPIPHRYPSRGVLVPDKVRGRVLLASAGHRPSQ